MEYEKTFTNELDTVKFKVDKEYCKFDRGIPFEGDTLGLHYKFGFKNIFFTVSCKLFSTSNSLGAITRNNFEDIAHKIFQFFGMIIPTQYFCEEVVLSRVDVKKDRIMSYNPSYYVANLRSLLKRKSNKYDVYKHGTVTYANGFSAIPKSRDKHRYSVYNKGKEINLAINKLYREQFDYAFLKDLNFCLRSEIQLENCANIKRAFDIGRNQKATFANLFSKDIDVVGEQFGLLLDKNVLEV